MLSQVKKDKTVREDEKQHEVGCRLEKMLCQGSCNGHLSLLLSIQSLSCDNRTSDMLTQGARNVGEVNSPLSPRGRELNKGQPNPYILFPWLPWLVQG